MLSKEDCKKFLRICKTVDCIKFNSVIKNNHLSQPAINKFMNSDDMDNFISLKSLSVLCEELYNSCGFVVDMYKEIILDQKIV